MADKRKKLKRQVSNDGGMTWQDMIPYEYIAGELIQKDSPDCNNIEWRTVSGYICEENTTEMIQWVADTGYVCVGFDKYNKEKEQVSYNSGISWADTGNTRAGSTLIEQNSEDCGYVPTPSIRWVADTGYVCVGYNKYNKEKEQQSTDGGEHWTDTGNTRAGSTLIEANSEDCGYIPPHDYSTEYLTTEALGDGNISLNDKLSGHSKIPLTNIQYSMNNGDWTEYNYDTNIPVVTGDKIRWKATWNDGNDKYTDSDYYCSYFASTADYKAYGNPISLLKNDSFIGITDISQYQYAFIYLFYDDGTYSSYKLIDVSGISLPATTLAPYCYCRMFAGCEKITTAPELPATTLAETCYEEMFYKCTSLTTAPELPATTLAESCYCRMFAGCKKITTAPELPATTLADYCYWSMFNGCSSLTTVALPATTLAYNCYNWMFCNCTSLTTAPELPATTLAESCYEEMFWNCTSLTTAPELPATTLAESCYEEMFYKCTSLTTAPELPATTLAPYCYCRMFHECTNLTTTPELSATTLADGCYFEMFSNCTSLTIAPELSATTLAESCYDGMFSGCTSLTSAPALPATTLAESCYSGMFYHCTSLTAAPELPATTLAEICYRYMFHGCTSLTTAPALPATTLAWSCYGQMFYGCTSLTTAPELPATTLAETCYEEMFYNCTSLNSVTCCATDLSAYNCTNEWLYNVASTGIFKKDAYVTWSRGISGIPGGWTIDTCGYKPYLTTEALGSGNISLNKYTDSGYESKEPIIDIQYSKNDGDWTAYTYNTEISVAAGDKIRWKGTFKDGNYGDYGNSYYSYFGTTADYKVYGNPLSILRNDSFIDEPDAIYREAYYRLFYNSSTLKDASNLALPATTLKDACYERMFSGCTSLTAAPALPATTLINYCYAWMFSGCTSLTAAPALPARTLVIGCYYMMFYGCTSLTTAPVLPATTLANECYNRIFENCSNLNYIKCLAKNISAKECTYEWVKNVASTGTFVKTSSMTKWSTGINGIPSGWTVQDA